MKRVALPNERQHTASVLLVTETEPRKVLLLHHRKFNVWIQPGGHVELYETPLQTAVREAQEETGIDVSEFLKPGEKVDQYAYVMPSPNFVFEAEIPPYGEEPLHYHVDHLYVVKLPEQPVQYAETEAHGIGWFTLEETKALPMFENTRYLIREALKA